MKFLKNAYYKHVSPDIAMKHQEISSLYIHFSITKIYIYANCLDSENGSINMNNRMYSSSNLNNIHLQAGCTKRRNSSGILLI